MIEDRGGEEVGVEVEESKASLFQTTLNSPPFVARVSAHTGCCRSSSKEARWRIVRSEEDVGSMVLLIRERRSLVVVLEVERIDSSVNTVDSGVGGINSTLEGILLAEYVMSVGLKSKKECATVILSQYWDQHMLGVK